MANLVFAPTKSGSNLVFAPQSATAIVPADTTAPLMVGTITVSAITSTSCVISWPAATDNVAVTGYEVSIDNGATYTDIGNVLTITETGLAPATAYYVKVRAYDAAGNRAIPLSATATTLASAVSTVTMVTVTPGTASGSQQFSATVIGTNAPSQSVTWATTLGTIGAYGLFTVPASTATIQVGTVTATSTQDGTKSGTASVSIAAYVPQNPDLFPKVSSFTLMRAFATDTTSRISSAGVDSIGTFL